MDTKEYQAQTLKLFRKLEDLLDEWEDDFDYDKSDGKIEIIPEVRGGKVVVNTQRAIQEIWLAGNAKAWHFKFREDTQDWFAEAEKAEFYATLTKILSDRCGKKISIK